MDRLIWIPVAIILMGVLAKVFASRSLMRVGAGLLATVLVVVTCALVLRMSKKMRAGGYSLLARAADNLTILGLICVGFSWPADWPFMRFIS
jgi:hypothetical protein